MSRHLLIPLATVGEQHDHRADTLAGYRDRRTKRRPAHRRDPCGQIH